MSQHPAQSMDHTLLSYEFFPPKTEKGEATFTNTLKELSRFQPDFISITYGAGGSNRKQTVDWVLHIQKEFPFPILAHLTCIGHSRNELKKILDIYKAHNLTQILALRGDKSDKMPEDVLQKGAFQHTDQFISFIRKNYPHFAVGAAAFPELHPESPDRDTDLHYFKAKYHAGARFAITQFFYENSDYSRLLDDCEKASINMPILPGIMPITDYAQIDRFAKLCGAVIPSWITSRLEK
ncbi:methylenetetrahydrofolate reductase, partial [Magnetococcales bacterium HHB-1]